MDERKYVETLEDIGKKLDPLEVEQLCFINDIGDTIENGAGFVKHLVDNSRISMNDNSYLKDCLESIDRTDLVTTLVQANSPLHLDDRRKSMPEIGNMYLIC